MPEVTSTDLYEVTMALSYLREGMRAPATFSLFVRDLPPGRGFLVAAGLEPALDCLSRFRVGRSDAEQFAEAMRRPAADLEPLRGLSFDGRVRAVPEGRIVLPGEPLLEVTAPGPKQVFRGPGLRDVIGLADETPPEGTEPLLRTVMRGGLRTEPPDTPTAARARFEADLSALPEKARRIAAPTAPAPVVSARLTDHRPAPDRRKDRSRTAERQRTPGAGRPSSRLRGRPIVRGGSHVGPRHGKGDRG
ncbi:hypothetical protein ABZZ04_28060 [Streptomyces sp. NPDC006435]|uniref:hypothetical protein n=1 Tax=Streptomyces sp. NPDC006435 TaxID=3154300 RepID=UPI00339F2D04